MKSLPLAAWFPEVSQLALGCMGMTAWDNSAISQQEETTAAAAVDTALEAGINLFDHADIYSRGKSEALFGRLLRKHPGLRESIFIQSKCGIRFADATGPDRYDLSAAWITASVDGILERLGCDYLDALLLHRPDVLLEPEEIAEVLQRLKDAGKVLHFGVSNMHLHQLQFLQSHLDMPLIVNQLELGLHHLHWVEEGILFNASDRELAFVPGTLEYCRTRRIQLQAWGALGRGLFTRPDTEAESEATRETAAMVRKLAERYQVACEAIVLAWIMRHPVMVQPVVGSLNPRRIRACAQAMRITLAREDWYALFTAARGSAVP